ncbi:MAG: indolepyruvate oxidoreductase subunit beta [Bacteroidales bacterium]|nr:indolepyruvate oxidoreductase subunit beta [Bacteroidales bacterium]MDT8432182.1 indolepyruvate oxidoreductase subunit beta [Bacteroidales bacterium]
MKTDIILAGVGGQGILSIAAVIGMAAIDNDLYVKQAEVHGMSQRGGAVQSHLRISDQPVHSDLIPAGSCDMILSVEPMESLRYVSFLSEKGWLITNSKPFVNINDYPDVEKIYGEIRNIPNSLLIDADAIAAEVGSRKVSNIVMLGASADYLGIDFSSLEQSIRVIFGRKGEEIVQMNINALNTGKKAARVQSVS